MRKRGPDAAYRLRVAMDHEQGDKYAPYRARWGFSLSADGRARGIESHLARGGGLLALHTAIICFDDWPGWKDILGGRWQWGRSSHPPYGRSKCVPTRPTIRCFAALPAFNLDDEAYGNLDLAPRVQPLMHAARRRRRLAAGAVDARVRQGARRRRHAGPRCRRLRSSRSPAHRGARGAVGDRRRRCDGCRAMK